MGIYDDRRQGNFIVSKIWNGMVDLTCCSCGKMVADLKGREMEELEPDIFLAKKEISCYNCKISIPAGKIVAPYIIAAEGTSEYNSKAEIREKSRPIWSLNGARGRSIRVYENKCIIKTEVTVGSLLTHNATDGEKTIYYSDVIGIQHKAPGLTLGYLQLETAGGAGNNQGSNFFNENTFTYESEQVSEEKIKEVVDYIQEKVEESKCAKNAPVITAAPISTADEIKKFKELLDIGAITQEEFDAKKKQLLGL